MKILYDRNLEGINKKFRTFGTEFIYNCFSEVITETCYTLKYSTHMKSQQKNKQNTENIL